MVNQPAPEGSVRSRAFYARFLETAAHSEDLIATFTELTAEDCRVHAQNGDVISRTESIRHAAFPRMIFPDLLMEVEDAHFPDDRLVVQVRMSGTSSSAIASLPASTPFVSLGSVVGRVGEDLRLTEMWSYVNPGFAFSFPPAGLDVLPPPEDGAGSAEARALYQSWVRRAEEGDDFVGAVAATFAPDGVVHVGNGDVGRVEALHALFAAVTRGLPDLSLTVDDALVSDSRVVVQFSMSGTHRGPLGLFPPTGKVLPSRGMIVGRADRLGRAAELWVYIAPAYALTIAPRGGPGTSGTS